MADAKALFKRHATHFDFIVKNTRIESSDGNVRQSDQNDALALAIIYGACIIAESIRTEMDESEIKVREDDLMLKEIRASLR